MASHVPAWKRLGLKLKYANEDIPVPQDASKGMTTNGTRVHDADTGLPERPIKRQRLDRHDKQENHVSTSEKQKSEKPVKPDRSRRKRGETSPAADPTKDGNQAQGKRKSVSFSNDTKAEDGDTRTTIDFPAGSPGSTPMKPKASRDEDLTSSPSPAATPIEEPKSTKTKREKGSKKPKTKLPKDKSRPALDYLQQHRLDRQSWKFNKNRDVWILSHALDSDAIPSTHILALAGYIRGLPDKAGARSRLTKDCREALDDHDTASKHSHQDKTEFLALLEDSQTSEDDALAFLDHRSRPAMLLWALDEDVVSTTKIGMGGTAATQIPAKKKKSRTMAPVDVSSSSESDSDSDSSDSSEQSDVRGGAKVRTAMEATDETYSSGTSSEDDSSASSSDSD